MEPEVLAALKKLREPFPEHQISIKCQPHKKDSPKGKCNKCGGWHGLPATPLNYVGHAALTDRLLEVDPLWTWEPMAVDAQGLPLIDSNGGMWIRLTVCGVTRLGYGDADGKTGGNAMKERIGDALRNAAMRFGAALDLWHKGELHPEDQEEESPQAPSAPSAASADRGWTIEAQEEFVDLLDSIFKVLKAGGHADSYQAIEDKWKVNKKNDPASLVLPKLREFLVKLQAAAKEQGAA